MVSRWAHNSKVGGSKPLSATFYFCSIFVQGLNRISLSCKLNEFDKIDNMINSESVSSFGKHFPIKIF